MTAYSRIQNKIWNSPTFKRLNDDAQKLWLYLLTCPHGNILGMFILKPGYVIEDLGWSKQAFTKAFAEVLEVPCSNGEIGLVKYDESNQLLLIKNYLEHNPLTNPNQITAAVKKLNDLPKSELFHNLKAFIEVFAEGFKEGLYEPLIKALGKPVTVAVAVTVTGAADESLSCPHGEITDLWNREMVSEGLPRVREWGSERKKHLNTRWKERKERQHIEWWLKLFSYIKKRENGVYVNPFLMGQVPSKDGRKRFFITLPWLVESDENISKVIEGFYERDER